MIIKKISVKEITAILVARHRATAADLAEAQRRTLVALKQPFPAQDPKVTLFNERCTEQMFAIAARRLKRNDRTKPLLSARDIRKILPDVLRLVEEVDGKPMAEAERRFVETAVCGMMEELLRAFLASANKNPYAANWQLISVVQRLAKKQHVSPTELLGRDGTNDEITRRLVTRAQFEQNFRRTAKVMFNRKTMLRIAVRPLLDAFANELTPEELKEFERKFVEAVGPQIRRNLPTMRKVAQQMHTEQLRRIYG